jgi:hypothetical protein
VCLITHLGTSPDLGYLDSEPIPLLSLLHGPAVPVESERLHERHDTSFTVWLPEALPSGGIHRRRTGHC